MFLSEMWLSVEDLVRLTGVERPTFQCKRLNKLGIPFIRSATGKPLVKPCDVGGSNEPNYKAITAKRKA